MRQADLERPLAQGFPFIPPFPTPLKSRPSLLKRLILGSNSWIHTLFERSYTMKMGSFTLPRLSFFTLNELPLAHQVLDDAEGTFPKHWLLNDLLDPLLGKGVFSVNGQEWSYQRQMINPAFAHTNLARAFPAMQAACASLITLLKAMDHTGPINIEPLMTHVTADIIFRTLFSRELSPGEAQSLYAAFNRYQKYAQRSTMLRLYGLPDLGNSRKAKRAVTDVRAIFEPLIRIRLAAYKTGEAAEHSDILDALLSARHPETEAAFSLNALVDQAAVIFLAGHETSASALSWALYLLAQSPNLQEQFCTELEEVTAGAQIDFAHLRGFESLRHVFKETLRLYPPVSFLPRAVTKPIMMRGKSLKPGDLLVISPWLIHRNPDNWQCPHSFDPERFARAEDAPAVRNSWIPFGRGPRSCIGAGFAQQEAVLVLATMLRHFRLSCRADYRPELVSRLTLRPKSGIFLMLTPR